MRTMQRLRMVTLTERERKLIACCKNRFDIFLSSLSEGQGPFDNFLCNPNPTPVADGRGFPVGASRYRLEFLGDTLT
jgi:hypothetical protein